MYHGNLPDCTHIKAMHYWNWSDCTYISNASQKSVWLQKYISNAGNQSSFTLYKPCITEILLSIWFRKITFHWFFSYWKVNPSLYWHHFYHVGEKCRLRSFLLSDLDLQCFTFWFITLFLTKK
jgi:hypothetical protein